MSERFQLNPRSRREGYKGALSFSEQSNQGAKGSESNSYTAEMDRGSTTGHYSRVSGTDNSGIWQIGCGRGRLGGGRRGGSIVFGGQAGLIVARPDGNNTAPTLLILSIQD